MTVLGPLESAVAFLPELILTVFLIGLLFSGFFFEGAARGAKTLLALAGIAAAIAAILGGVAPAGQALFAGMVVLDTFAVFFKLLALAVTFLAIIFAYRSREPSRSYSEFLVLLYATALGMALMASATDLLMMYLAVELTSVPCYVLAGFIKGQRRSTEAALKYVIYGGVSSGIMLFGMSILFGLTGTTNLYEINAALAQDVASPLGLLLSVVFILAGLGYKIASVPFHFWAPDVYEGAPTPVTAFLSVGPKAAGFALTIRFFYGGLVAPAADGALSALHVDWPLLLAAVSALTMSLGNLAAIGQQTLKRMLAYSSIAHAGYILMGVVLLTREGLIASLFYLSIYFFMNLGAFLTVIYLADRMGSERIDDYAGLAWRVPGLAVATAIFLVALAGIPPTAGFVGKFYLFAAVIHQEMYWLAAIGMVNTVVSLYYYARVIRAMFLVGEVEGPTFRLPLFDRALLWVLVGPLLILGIYWVPALRFAERSFAALAGP